MTFITGTITHANPGPTLYAAMETALLAAGYALSDTVVIGARTHKVLKSPAAGNSYNLDWYLDISFPTTGTTLGLMMAPFEGYDAATDLGYRGPYGVSDTTIEATYYSRYGATGYALETNWANNSSYAGLATGLTTGAFTYWISITTDRVILMVSNIATHVHYCGFWKASAAHTSYAGASLFPLIVSRLALGAVNGGSTAPSSTATAVTRMPKYPSLASGQVNNTYGWVNVCVPSSTSFGVYPYVGGIAGIWAHPATGEASISECPVVLGDYSGTSIRSGYVGTLDGLAAGYVTSAAARGDTVTIGSDTWYVQTPSNSVALFFKGA